MLVLSPDVAGIGLTLVEANHVIHYGRWWNPVRESQATDRVYRIGQERDVHIYYPMRKMKIPSLIGNLIYGALLALLTVGLLMVIKHDEGLSGVNQVITVMSGMTAMAALTTFQRLLKRDNRNSLVDITFNEMFLSRAISEGLPKLEGTRSKVEREVPSSFPPWELTAGQLVGADNALALARLRIDIERELRRMALETQIDLSLRPYGVKALAHELVSKEVLPETFMGPLEEVVNICNIAIHGRKVAEDVAIAVVRVGGQLLEQLRLLPKQRQQTKE